MSAIGTLLFLAAAFQGPSTLVIRHGEATVSVSVMLTQRGPMVRLEDALAPLGAALVRGAGDRFRLVAGGAEIDLTLGLAVVKAGARTEQLAAAPAMFEGKLLVPLSLLTDLLPRVSRGYAWDAPRRELRRAVTTGVSDAPPSTASPPRRAAPAPDRERPPPRRERTPHVVVVDPGHGGPDRGMRGPIGSRRYHEADITLGVSRRLRAALQKRGFGVVMTRTTDTLIALHDRGHIANRAKGSVFVSVHVNAANPRWRRPQDARGFETYFLSTAKTDDERRVEEMENEAVKYEGEESVSSDDPLSFILNDMKQNEYLRESSDFAMEVQQALAAMPHPGVNRGVKQAGFRVLVTAYMPAVLVEIGFGTNAAEVRYLTSAAGQHAIAEAIATATAAYLARLDRRTANGVSPDE
jgi:N-acetylmuramoyl-L-alanine amidase